MKKLLFVIVAAALAWSAFWFFQASALRSAIENWKDREIAAGRDVSYSDVKVAGFPNRLDTTFTDLTLANPDTGWSWTAPQFQILRMVYTDRQVIFAFPNSQVVSNGTTDWTITSERLLASLRRDRSDALVRFIAEAPFVNIDGSDDSAVALAAANFAIEQTEGDAGLYRASLSGDIATPSGEAAANSLLARSELRFASALVPGQDRPAIQQINLIDGQYGLGETQLSLSGDFDVDKKGRMTGDLSLETLNWRAMLEQAEDNLGFGRDGMRFLNDVLTLVASFQGNKDQLNVTLRLNKGNVSLGPLPVGKLPRIPQP